MPWPKLPFPIAACAPKMGSFTGSLMRHTYPKNQRSSAFNTRDYSDFSKQEARDRAAIGGGGVHADCRHQPDTVREQFSLDFDGAEIVLNIHDPIRLSGRILRNCSLRQVLPAPGATGVDIVFAVRVTGIVRDSHAEGSSARPFPSNQSTRMAR
jgi:hypothetical protein